MKITLIAGSNRLGSMSTLGLRYVESLLKQQNFSTHLIELRVTPLPFFDPHSESVSTTGEQLIEAVQQADGLVIATPEYHGSISGLLKNALDYLDNPDISGKPVLAISAAGGPLGNSSLLHLQTIVRNLHGIFCPQWISLREDAHAFDQNGRLIDEALKERIHESVRCFIELVRDLRGVSLYNEVTEALVNTGGKQHAVQ